MQRTRLGDELISRVRREPRNTSFLWAIGRFGARIPLYGPLNLVVPPAAAERWLEILRGIKTPGADVLAAAAQIAARTDDPVRDIGDEARPATFSWLEPAGAPPAITRSLAER